MSTKENVLRLLMEQRESLSGERIARRLGVSRNSVWKAIERLRQDGYQIEAATNRGYLLTASPDRVAVPEIERWLRAKTIGARMELHDQLDSTNNRAKALAASSDWPVTVLYDTNQDMMRTLNISSIPHVFVYDKNGKQVYSHTGYIPGDEEALLQKLLQAK